MAFYLIFMINPIGKYYSVPPLFSFLHFFIYLFVRKQIEILPWLVSRSPGSKVRLITYFRACMVAEMRINNENAVKSVRI